MYGQRPGRWCTARTAIIRYTGARVIDSAVCTTVLLKNNRYGPARVFVLSAATYGFRLFRPTRARGTRKNIGTNGAGSRL